MGPLRICVTGAAGQIAYALLPMIARGDVFGNRRMILTLLDIPAALNKLNGVLMELRDCAYSLICDIVATVDPLVAFMDVDFCIMLGAFPRKDGMLRKDLLGRNGEIFRLHAEVINQVS